MRNQLQRCRIDAVTQTGRRWPVGEHMAQMSIAFATLHFDAVHAVAEIIQAGNGIFTERLKVAGPATPGVKLGIRIEQLSAAAGAVINTRRLAVMVFAGKGSLRATQPTDMKLRIRQLFAPGFQGFFELVQRHNPQ